MNPLESVRAIIFDMDGVLWDSTAAHAQAYAEVFQSEGLTDYDYRDLAGRRTDEAIRLVLARHGPAADSKRVDNLVRRKQQRATSLLWQQPPVAPESAALLRRLAERHVLALASSSRPENVQLFLDASGTASQFRHVLSGADVTRAKPDAEIYRRAVQLLGFPPEQVLSVEDSVSGVQASRSAAVPVLGLLGTTTGDELVAAGAIGVLERLTDIEGRLVRLLGCHAALSRGGRVNRDRWSAIIPAAGRGTRLGFDHPKILYPILGRPILDWLIDLLEPLCGHLVFVLSPHGRAEVEVRLAARLAGRYRVVVQAEPTGMGDAILLARTTVETPHCLVIWGDQMAIRPQTLLACVGVHESEPGIALTLPTVMRTSPYIHFRRASDARIVGVEQAREGPISVSVGENDCGVFCFRSSVLFDQLERNRRQGAGVGRGTGEFNLLPVLPQIDAGPASVRTIRIDDVTETFGVNTPQEADQVAMVLARRLRRAG